MLIEMLKNPPLVTPPSRPSSPCLSCPRSLQSATRSKKNCADTKKSSIFAFRKMLPQGAQSLHTHHSMKHLVAIVMVSLACAVIMLHAVVPHHHHDCCGTVGLVFEDEACCHCDEACHDRACEHHHGQHSHHPFDNCLLQEMLSQLTLSNTDKYYFAALIKAEAQGFLLLFLPAEQSGAPLPALGLPFRWPAVAAPAIAVPYIGAISLRAPPF